MEATANHVYYRCNTDPAVAQFPVTFNQFLLMIREKVE
jgi:hypothetical protein